MERAAAGARDRVLVLQHEPELAAGLFGQWALARGFELDVRPALGGWAAPDPAAFAFVCSLGSHDHSFDDDLPWLRRELELLRGAHEAGVPVLGICFGSQARALGGETGPAPRLEVGWIEVEPLDPGAMAAGPWLFWHEDRFEVPAGGELLARTAVGPAAFRVGRSVGVQFHPELTSAGLERMVREGGQRLAPGVVDELRAGLEAEPERLRERAWSLYDGVLGAAVPVAAGTKEG